MVMHGSISTPRQSEVFHTARIAPFVFLFLGILLPSCGDAIDPNPPSEFLAADYAWSETSSDLTYVRKFDGQEVTHTLRFESGAITDDCTDVSGGPLGSVTLAYQHAPAGVQLLGCGSTSLPYIPADIRFQDVEYFIPGPDANARLWLNCSVEEMLVVDVAGVLNRYDLISQNWEREDVPWSSAVTAIARDTTGDITRTLCGTESDGLFARDQYGTTWYNLPSPGGRIDAIEGGALGTLFAVANGELFQNIGGVTSWEPFPIPTLATGVTGIAMLNLDATRSMLLIGRESSGLVHIDLESSVPTQWYFPQSALGENIADVRCKLHSPYPNVAIANPPKLHVSTQESGSWVDVPLPFPGPATSVCQSDESGIILIGSNDGVYRFDGSAVSRSGLDGRRVISLHYGPDGSFYCGTPEGSYRSDSDGRQWTPIGGGHVERRPTGLTLLPASFSVGSTWDAGVLIVGNEDDRRLTGRVLEHFNEFILPDGRGRFADVIVVRYAQETPQGLRREGEYYWTVYFARGRGPIYFEEAIDGTVQASTCLISP